MSGRNVLTLLPLPTRNDLRAAIAKIVRAVQTDNDLSDFEMSEAIGVSESTVRNARNKNCDLNALTIARIGAKYGEHYTDPYHALYGARSVPAAVANAPDPMPSMMALAHKLSAAGGIRTHNVVLDAKQEIEEAYATISALRSHAMDLAA